MWATVISHRKWQECCDDRGRWIPAGWSCLSDLSQSETEKDTNEPMNSFAHKQCFQSFCSSTPPLRSGLLLLFLVFMMPAAVFGKGLSIDLKRHYPSNMFFVPEEVIFEGRIAAEKSGQAELTVTVTDYYNDVVELRTIPVDLTSSRKVPVTINLGKMGIGYYELKIDGKMVVGNKELTGSHALSLGVAERINRTAKEVRDGGYRFGLKMWYLGKAWWRGNYEFDEKDRVLVYDGNHLFAVPYTDLEELEFN